MSSQWTRADRRIGLWSCYLVFALGLAYVPTMIAGFVAVGGLSAPIPDPYLAAMELLGISRLLTHDSRQAQVARGLDFEVVMLSRPRHS